MLIKEDKEDGKNEDKQEEKDNDNGKEGVCTDEASQKVENKYNDDDIKKMILTLTIAILSKELVHMDRAVMKKENMD